MRKFKNKSFADDTQATKWSPDSCDCVIIYDKVGKFLDDENRCKLHIELSKQKLLNEVLKHNQSFNEKFGKGINYTEEQKTEIMNDKIKERQRIKKL